MNDHAKPKTRLATLFAACGVVLIGSTSGCGPSRLFSRNPADGNGFPSSSHRSARPDQSGGVRVMQEGAVPETPISPVPQRLVTGNVTTVSHEEPVASQNAKPVSAVAEQSASGEALGEESYAGVDAASLMEALRDSPPEVQREALRRLVAMSRLNAKASGQPKSIDDELAGSLGSLPTLPDVVTDGGASPMRIAAAATAAEPIAMQFSDAASKPKKKSLEVRPVSMRTPSPKPELEEQVALAVMQDPVVEQAPATATAKSLSQSELFDELVSRLQEPVPGESADELNRRLIMARNVMVLAGNPDGAVDKLEGLTVQEQEYVRHQLLGLWKIVDPKGHPAMSRRMTSALPEIREANKFLSAATDSLEVRALEFCTEIEAYGQVKPFPKREFKPGQQVILYCEIENFRARDVDGGYETTLQGSYDLLDASGAKVTSQSLPIDRQVSKNHLRDYFIAYQMYLPESLDSGIFKLRLTMEDVHGKKYGQAEIPFEIRR